MKSKNQCFKSTFQWKLLGCGLWSEWGEWLHYVSVRRLEVWWGYAPGGPRHKQRWANRMIKFIGHLLSVVFFLPTSVQLLEGRDFFFKHATYMICVYSHSNTCWLKLWPSKNQEIKILKIKGMQNSVCEDLRVWKISSIFWKRLYLFIYLF